jgi:hypothetical protein
MTSVRIHIVAISYNSWLYPTKAALKDGYEWEPILWYAILEQCVHGLWQRSLQMCGAQRLARTTAKNQRVTCGTISAHRSLPLSKAFSIAHNPLERCRCHHPAEYIVVFQRIDQTCVIQVYCTSQLSPEQPRSSLRLFASSAMISL